MSPFFSQLDTAWAEWGIVVNVKKEQNRCASGQALGLELVRGAHLLPKAIRLYDLTCGIITLLTWRRTSQTTFGVFFGMLLWMLLSNRPLLSACSDVYAFLDSTDDPEVDLPRGVLNELGHIATLLFATAIGLTATWSPQVWATAGAEDFGYGGASAQCDPEAVRALAGHVHRWGRQFIPADC